MLDKYKILFRKNIAKILTFSSLLAFLLFHFFLLFSISCISFLNWFMSPKSL